MEIKSISQVPVTWKSSIEVRPKKLFKILETKIFGQVAGTGPMTQVLLYWNLNNVPKPQ